MGGGGGGCDVNKNSSNTSLLLMVSCKFLQLYVSMVLVFLYLISEAIRIFHTNFQDNCLALCIHLSAVLATIFLQP